MTRGHEERENGLGESVVTSGHGDTVARLRRLATLCDAAFSIPGAKHKIGWDSI